MTDLNHIVATGRLVRDPILRRATTGTSVAMFTIAVNHYYRDKAGAFQQEAAFINCIAFARAAEMLTHRLKGEPIMVNGRLRTDTWEQDAEKRSQLTLVCDAVRCFAAGSIAPTSSESSETSAKVMEMAEDVKASVPF
jgi:single-strand DNA-binding protein